MTVVRPPCSSVDPHVVRMEAFGRLVGGVAHDFNNLLTVIRGYSELLTGEVGELPEAQVYLQEVLLAADRAVVLTQQLNAFSRHRPQEATREVLAQEVIPVQIKMLRRLLGEGIELRIEVAETLALVAMTQVDFEALIIRSIAEAACALGGNGRLEVVLSHKAIRKGDDRAQQKGWPSGRYIHLSLKAVGGEGASLKGIWAQGEDQKTAAALRENLLSALHALGENHEVMAEVLEEGALQIFLPMVKRRAIRSQPAVAPRASLSPQGQGEVILLVEDDQSVLRLMRRQLEALGYTVESASNGEEALRVVKQSAKIDLVLSDVVMPLMGGLELSERLRALLPTVKVVLMSGYPIPSDHAVEEQFFLSKPLPSRLLACKIREFIESK